MSEMFNKIINAIKLRDTTDECAIARAVLEAMREPTDAMCLAPADAGNEHRAKNIWQDMIDEILR